MKALADKLFCGAGIVTLAACIVWAFTSMQGIEVETVGSLSNESPRSPADTISVPEIQSETPYWAAPVSQDLDNNDWIYGVFTPPKIYVVDGKFSAEPPTPGQPDPEIDVELVAFEQQLYRFQFEGYVEEDPLEPRKNLAMLFDRETQFSVRARVGREFPEEGIRVLDLSIERKLGPDGVVDEQVVMMIQEIETGREVSLEYGVPRFDEDLFIKIQSTLTAETVELDQTSKTFELNELVYEVVNVDTAASQITVRKPIPDSETSETVTETLSLSPPSQGLSSATSSGLPRF